AALQAKLAAWRGDARPGVADSNQPVPDSGIRTRARPGDPFQEVFEREADLVTASRPLSTLLALEAVAQHMGGLPGRKNLLWITGGLPLTMNLEHPARLQNIREKRNFGQEAARAVRALNAAGVALYSIDARG
ncbi:MAG TPA: hypothetical protein DEH78_12520, partial [Solibacterales bacterium]|nr:hypothetical protein [Bryobacterales bacterium]